MRPVEADEVTVPAPVGFIKRHRGISNLMQWSGCTVVFGAREHRLEIRV